MRLFYLGLLSFYAFLYVFYLWGKENKVQFNYPSRNIYPVFGLDASHHQGEIDWQKIDADLYKFVYLKATEGETFRDKRFLENYQGAKKRGLKVGAYHFWSFCKDPLKQVKNIMAVVPRAQGDLVPALDMETIQKCDFASNAEEKRAIRDHVKVALEELSFQYGKPPVIYTTMDFLSQHRELQEYETEYWVRSLVGPPFLKKINWLIWQYHNSGSIDGIEGPVDLNAMKESLGLEKITQP
jgi:lysozyme